MWKMPLPFFKLALLVLLQSISYWLYSFNINFLEELLPIRFSGVGVYFGIVLIHFIAICLTALVLCFPIAFFYQGFSLFVAFILGTTVLAPRIANLIERSSANFHPFVVGLNLFDGLLYLVLLVVFSGYARRFLLQNRATSDNNECSLT